MKLKLYLRAKRRLLNSWLFLTCFLATPPAWSAVRIVNDGIPGQNSKEVAARLEEALKKFQPQAVVIFVGMNDAVNDKKFLEPDTTLKNLRLMVKESKAAGCKVVLVSLHEPDVVRLLQRHKPEVYGSRTPAERIQDVNREIDLVAQEEQIPVADFHQVLQQAGGASTSLSPDGVHLNAKGYGLLAAAVRDTLLPAGLTDQSTVLCIGDSLTFGIGVRPARSSKEGSQTYPAQLGALLNSEEGMKRSIPN